MDYSLCFTYFFNLCFSVPMLHDIVDYGSQTGAQAEIERNIEGALTKTK